MKPLLIPVILAGGSGTRLWPLSRESRPKQLVALVGDETLYQQTVRRVLAMGETGPLVVVGSVAHRNELRRQLDVMTPAPGLELLLEPCGRNTAAAIAFAGLHAADRFDRHDLLLVCPSDHLVERPEIFGRAVEQARALATAGELVTFGISPDRPETGYGYIESGEPWTGHEGVHQVVRFVEKPRLQAAEAMLAAGDHFWNSGIFLFRVDRILEELALHAPDVLEQAEAAYRQRQTGPDGAVEVGDELWARVPSVPIDRAVMERTERIAVVPCDPGWSDLGSWHAVWEHAAKDGEHNATTGDAVLERTAGCLVRGEGGRLVACAGVSDLAIVDTSDALLVASRGDADAVRALVAALGAAGRKETKMDTGEDRPWGRFDVLHEGPGFKVKEIRVDPGGCLSLQSHRHRAEHWVVVRGKAKVTVGETVKDLLPNQSVHIPLGAKHRLENPFQEPMHLIEVQCGSYLGEDDIVRYGDVYGRS